MEKYQPKYYEGVVNSRFLYYNQFTYLTPLAGVRLNVRGWNFLDIFSNGNCNPFNNYGADGIHQNSHCYIEFNDGDRYLINGDTMNLPLIKKQFLDWHNRLGASQGANDGLETGYNQLFFMLKNTETNPFIEKENPNYCTYYEIPADETIIWWFGVKRFSAAWNLAIPYIPYGYEKIGILFETDATTYTAEWRQHHCNTTYLHTTALNEGCNHINCCSRQHSLLIHNREASTKIFNFNVHFLNKSNNM